MAAETSFPVPYFSLILSMVSMAHQWWWVMIHDDSWWWWNTPVPQLFKVALQMATDAQLEEKELGRVFWCNMIEMYCLQSHWIHFRNPSSLIKSWNCKCRVTLGRMTRWLFVHSFTDFLEDIPCVYSLHKMKDTFLVPESSGNISCQLCFILDYTAHMKTQISQAKDAWLQEHLRFFMRISFLKTVALNVGPISLFRIFMFYEFHLIWKGCPVWTKFFRQESISMITNAVKNLRLAAAPNATVDLEMTAVAYTDWDADSAKLGRPVVAAFGGKDGPVDNWEFLWGENWWGEVQPVTKNQEFKHHLALIVIGLQVNMASKHSHSPTFQQPEVHPKTLNFPISKNCQGDQMLPHQLDTCRFQPGRQIH